MASEELMRFLFRTGMAVRNFFRGPLLPLPEKQCVVVCPQHEMPAAVTLDFKDRLVACSRRQDKITCGEDCGPQLHYTTDDLETFLLKNREKSCRVCGTPIGAKDWYASRLAAAQNPHRRSGEVLPEITTGSAGSTCYGCLR